MDEISRQQRLEDFVTDIIESTKKIWRALPKNVREKVQALGENSYYISFAYQGYTGKLEQCEMWYDNHAKFGNYATILEKMGEYGKDFNEFLRKNYGFEVEYFEINFVDKKTIRIPVTSKTPEEKAKLLESDLKKLFLNKKFEIFVK